MSWELADIKSVFEVVLPGHEDVVFECRFLDSKVIQGILKKHTKKRIMGRKAGVEEEIDSYAAGQDIFCQTVTGWRGITFNGSDYPCTDENKKSFYKRFNTTTCQYILESVAEANEQESGLILGN